MSVVREANAEPIPGYRLLERLGRGGFGEVWKCEAPGGLFKAIKFVDGHGDFVHGSGDSARQELASLQRIKALRHPFLLSIERVELIDDDLVLVTELADRSLHDLLVEYRAAGREGLPRTEALAYLRETAEVLDLLNLESGLQHLDVKPRNLFLVARHVKVADFGLVNSLADLHSGAPDQISLGAVSPLYAAPEAFHGSISLFSDQYSLAITYHELLTGSPPFTGTHFQQLALAHMRQTPDLSRLPESDRAAVARALAKEPRQRFPSCTAFVDALEGKAVALPASRGQANPRTDSDFAPGEMAATAVLPSGMLGLVGDAVRRPPPSGGDALAGYRFLECLARQPIAEVWRAAAPDGRVRQVKFVFGFDADSATPGGPLARLGQLRHVTLMPIELVVSEGRLAVLSDQPERTLADLFKERQQLGQPGLEREELLEYLWEAATALDELHQLHHLRHLCLSPRHLAVFADGRLRLLDFGLAELVWIPAGHSAGSLSTRYAAPELFDGGPSASSDQYSLALIYQELLTGTHAFRNLNPRQMAAARLRGKPDLGLLPAPERAVILRALDLDPARRFANSIAFVEALATVRKGARPGARPQSEMSATVRPESEAPTRTIRTSASLTRTMHDLVRVASSGVEVRDLDGLRCCVRSGPALEHHCFAQLLPTMVRLKLRVFAEQWSAERTADTGERFAYRIPLSGGLMQRLFGRGPALEVEILLRECSAVETTMTPLTITLRTSGTSASRSAEVLEDSGREVLESLRSALVAVPERRRQERWSFDRSVHVRPVQGGVAAGVTLPARTKDVSLSGLGLYLPGPLEADEVLVRVEPPQGGEPVDLCGRVVRTAPCRDGRLEVGVLLSDE
jgi:serine/threonine protein kinase